MKESTLFTGVSLLKMFSRTEPERGVTQLSTEIGQHKSRVHRLLGDLVNTGFVRKDSLTSRYSLGWGLFEVANEVGQEALLRLVSRGPLEKLNGDIPGRVQLCILQSGTNVVINSLDGQYRFSLLEAIGTRRPAYYGASGKILMAYTDADIRAQLLPKKLVKFTEKSIVELPEFEAGLEPIRRQGYAYSKEEAVKWVSGISVPIFSPNGAFIAAISLGLPVRELKDSQVPSIVHRMKLAAASITDGLMQTSIKKKTGNKRTKRAAS